MRLDLCIPSFMDELEKIAHTYGLGGYQQTRAGRRPIRVQTLLKKETPTQDVPDASEERYKQPERGTEYEGGSGMTEGIGNYMGGA